MRIYKIVLFCLLILYSAFLIALQITRISSIGTKKHVNLNKNHKKDFNLYSKFFSEESGMEKFMKKLNFLAKKLKKAKKRNFSIARGTFPFPSKKEKDDFIYIKNNNREINRTMTFNIGFNKIIDSQFLNVSLYMKSDIENFNYGISYLPNVFELKSRHDVSNPLQKEENKYNNLCLSLLRIDYINQERIYILSEILKNKGSTAEKELMNLRENNTLHKKFKDLIYFQDIFYGDPNRIITSKFDIECLWLYINIKKIESEINCTIDCIINYKTKKYLKKLSCIQKFCYETKEIAPKIDE